MNDSNNPSHQNHHPSDKPGAETLEGRRLLVALELLARAVDKSTVAVLENIKEHANPKEDKGKGRAARDARQTQEWMQKAGLVGPPAKLTKHQKKLLKRIRNPRARKAVKAAFLKRNAARGKVPTGGGAAGVGAILQGLLRMLGPMAVLAALISTNASGMELLAKGTRLLAAVFAPILLPITVLLAVAMLGVSDVIWQHLLPALGGWMRFILAVGIPVMKVFFDAIGFAAKWYVKLANVQIDVYNALIDLVNKIPGVNVGKLDRIPEVPDAAGPDWQAEQKKEEQRRLEIIRVENDKMNARATEIHDQVGNENKAAGRPEHGPNDARIAMEIAKRERDARLAEQGIDAENPRAGLGPPQPPGGIDIKKLMQEVIQTLEFSAGPKASLGDLGAPRGAAQLAAVNSDPFEKRIEMMFKQTIDILKQVAAELPDKQKPVMGQPGGGFNVPFGAGVGPFIPGGGR